MPKENGPFCAAFIGAAHAEMPRYDVEVLSSYTDEYVIYSENGRYSLSASPRAEFSCVRVMDNYNSGAIVGCFECDGAQSSCSEDPQCPSAYTDTIYVNGLIRRDIDTPGSDYYYYCAAPKLATNDYNGFCQAGHYNDDRIYSPVSANNTTTYRLGDWRIYYNQTSRCFEQLENVASGYYCTTGYYLNGTTCTRCPNGASTGGSGYHQYGQSRACASTVNCTSAQYNGANYHLSSKTCLTCPSGAKCDGEHVYCPAGSYVFSNGTNAPTCASCPDGGSAMNYYTDTLGNCIAGYDGSMGIPNHLWYGHSIGLSTACKWTNEESSNGSVCAKIGGSDATGTYMYDSDGNYDVCYYE